MVHFTVERWKPGSHWSTSTDVRFVNFHGLSRDTIENGGPAKFEYVQDAGRLLCQGEFSWSRDREAFSSSPIRNSAAELKTMGYDSPDEEPNSLPWRSAA